MRLFRKASVAKFLSVYPTTGAIKLKTLDWRQTKRHRITRKKMEYPTTALKIFDSSPSISTAVAAMANDCGEIILPVTPPTVLAASRRSGLIPMLFAAVTCNLEKSALAEV